MYERFYGFTEKPFQLNPDPQFYFDSRQHRRAMAFVEYGLHQSEGFIVITGEVGAGKTTLVRNLLSNLNSDEVVAAHLVSTQLEADDMLRMVAAAFGVRSKDMAKADLLLSIEAVLANYCRQGKRCLLIVDEAQNLSHRAVEELRMLSNFQLATHALLQTFLVGQPEFRLILQSPEMMQLRQRVIAACHIGPLDAEDTQRYIEHRLRRVGWKDVPLIAPDAFRAVYEASGGVPRRINMLCDRVLLSGFLADKRVFTAQTVREIAAEIQSETQVPQPPAAAPTHAHTPVEAIPMRDPAMVADLEAPRGLPRSPGGAPALVPQPSQERLDSHLQQVEQEMKDLKETLLRVERGNHATLGLFRRFLEWVRSQESDRTPRH